MVKPRSDIKTAIARCQLFKSAAPDALAPIAENAKMIFVRRAARIYAEGERSAAFYIVASGRVVLSIGAAPAATKVIELIGTGGHCGLAAAILGTPHVTSADTLADSTLLVVPHAVLIEQAAAHAELALRIATGLSREIFALTDDISAYCLRSGRQRVAGFLLRIAAANAARSRPFPLPAKKSIIASRLGLTPEYFSRMLHDLIATGAIAVEGRHVTILDSARLREPDSVSA